MARLKQGQTAELGQVQAARERPQRRCEEQRHQLHFLLHLALSQAGITAGMHMHMHMHMHTCAPCVATWPYILVRSRSRMYRWDRLHMAACLRLQQPCCADYQLAGTDLLKLLGIGPAMEVPSK